MPLVIEFLSSSLGRWHLSRNLKDEMGQRSEDGMAEERLCAKAPGWGGTWYTQNSGIDTQRRTKVIVILIQVINASGVLVPYVLDFPGQSQIFHSITVVDTLVLVVSWVSTFNLEYMTMFLFRKYGYSVKCHCLKNIVPEYTLLQRTILAPQAVVSWHIDYTVVTENLSRGSISKQSRPRAAPPHEDWDLNTSAM